MPTDLAQILQKAMPADPTSANSHFPAKTTLGVTESSAADDYNSKSNKQKNRSRSSRPKKLNQRTKSHGAAPNNNNNNRLKINKNNSAYLGEQFDINSTLDRLAELEA